MAAARALALGDPLGALKRVALRDDPPAMALRGIAMAQLGDYVRARVLVRRAAKAFGAREPVARARCVIAEAEIALATRDLTWPERDLDAARGTLEAHGDRVNAAHARYLAIRRSLLIGRLDAAEAALAPMQPLSLPPALRAIHHLSAAGTAMRRMHARAAHAAIGRARHAAREAGVPALSAEVESLSEALDAPVARRLMRGSEDLLTLAQVEALIASGCLLVDACRFVVCAGETGLSLASRPVLFALARALAEAWPGDAARNDLITTAFRTRYVDETHRARLRVEIGRLRAALRTLAAVRATPRGFELIPRSARSVAVLTRPVEGEHAVVLAVLSDGEAWSSSALALALGASQRKLQRELLSLAMAGKVQALGRGRARRWLAAPAPGFTTPLLLPGTLPGD